MPSGQVEADLRSVLRSTPGEWLGYLLKVTMGAHNRVWQGTGGDSWSWSPVVSKPSSNRDQLWNLCRPLHFSEPQFPRLGNRNDVTPFRQFWEN